MNTIWFFGDSFTAGEGYNFEQFSDSSSINFKKDLILDDSTWNSHPYFSRFNKWKTNHQHQIWPYLVSNHFEMKCINKGENASSNQQILNRILSNINNFKKGDMLIVGYTVPYRLFLPSTDSNILMKTCLIESLEKNSEIKEIGLEEYSDIEKTSIVDYLYNIIHQYDENIELHEKKIYKNLFSFLNSLDITTLLWDYTHWHNYENIDEATGGKIKDKHWSIKGHKDFSKLIIKSITNNINELERQNKNSVFNKFKKNLFI